MKFLIALVLSLSNGFKHPMMYVVNLKGKIQPKTLKTKLNGSKTIFSGHALQWYAPDTLILITEKKIVVQLPGGSTPDDYRRFAVETAQKLGIGSLLDIESGKFTSKFCHSYFDEKGEPSLGCILTARGGKNGLGTQKVHRFDAFEKRPPKTNSDKSVVILYKSNIGNWAAIDSLHEIYSGQYVDLNYTNKISERLADLQSIGQKHVIVVADKSDLDPNFMHDADTTVRAIDSDEFQDATLNFITGFTADNAEDLATADNPTDSKTIVIANPDGSLLSSGYSGIWVTNYLNNDGNYLGGERLYVNTSTNADENANAQNIADEFNNISRQNIIFLDHGYYNSWALRSWPSGRAHDCIAGFNSDLRTWEDTDGNGYLDNYYTVDNDANSFVYAGGCLTARINGARETNWEPWESTSGNTSGNPDVSITLAWLEDSPGTYIGSHSVSYGEPFLKLLLLNIAKGNDTPSEALRVAKDVYNFIIGDETTDNDPSDGTTDDYLEYLRHEFVNFGKPTWQANLDANTSPDYSVWLDELTQVDQHPALTRGYVYVGEAVQYTSTTHIQFNEELAHEPWGSAEEDSMPFTYIFVENVGGNGSSVWASNLCAVIAGEIEPGKTNGYPADVDSIKFASGDPSDAQKLYEHYWNGSGNSDAIEIFKARENPPDRIFWLVAAGITDVDNNSQIEWRINSGYSKSFDVEVFMPAVQSEIIDTSDLGNSNWSQTVVVWNPASVTPNEVIVRVSVQNGTSSADSVRPDTLVHDLVLVDDGGQKFVEFTLDSVPHSWKASAETLVVYYSGEPSELSEPPERPEIPQKLDFHIRPTMSSERFNLVLELPEPSDVELKIFDVSGRCVRTFKAHLPAGTHRMVWDGTDEKGIRVSSGIYFGQLKIGNHRLLRRMLLIGK